MIKKEEKVLTQEIVKRLGLNEIPVITADMLEGYTSIGGMAFYNCIKLISIEIPNSVTKIGRAAFAYCSSLISIINGNSVKTIENGAFYLCKGLISVTIPNSVTSIGYQAFYLCKGLTSVTIPESVTSIGDYAFEYCTGLTSVTIPEGVTSIGSSAFSGCTSLTSVTIPEGVTSIGEFAFNDVPNIVYSGSAKGSPWGAKSVNGYVDGYLVYSDDSKTTLLGCPAFVQGEVIIPNGVTIIGERAFYYCSSLTSITIPNSVTSIGREAFYGCRSLTSVTIGSKTYKSQIVTNSKCKAYKAFDDDMTCRGFQYEEGKIYELEGEPRLCEQGFHACLSFADVFNYYSGVLEKEIHIHEVELEGVNNERRLDSKIVAKKITIGKRIL